MSYKRILPRDLFNESKLLKCIGQLVLMIHDEKSPCKITFNEDGQPFKIEQFEHDGSLFVSNLHFCINDNSVIFKTTYNSKESYPLYAEFEEYEYEVFDNSGNFHGDFIELCESIIK